MFITFVQNVKELDVKTFEDFHEKDLLINRKNQKFCSGPIVDVRVNEETIEIDAEIEGDLLIDFSEKDSMVGTRIDIIESNRQNLIVIEGLVLGETSDEDKMYAKIVDFLYQELHAARVDSGVYNVAEHADRVTRTVLQKLKS